MLRLPSSPERPSAVHREVNMRSLNLSLAARLGTLAALLACGGRADAYDPSASGGNAPASEDPEPAPPAPPAIPMEVPCVPDGVWRGSARVAEQADLERLRGCERIAGDLSIELFAGLDPAPLAALRVVEGVVSVRG